MLCAGQQRQRQWVATIARRTSLKPLAAVMRSPRGFRADNLVTTAMTDLGLPSRDGETDAEVVAHVIEEHIGEGLTAAACAAAGVLEGHYAFCAVSVRAARGHE